MSVICRRCFFTEIYEYFAHFIFKPTTYHVMIFTNINLKKIVVTQSARRTSTVALSTGQKWPCSSTLCGTVKRMRASEIMLFFIVIIYVTRDHVILYYTL